MGFIDMSVRFRDYCYGYRIASLALDDCAKDKQIEKDLSVLYIGDAECYENSP